MIGDPSGRSSERNLLDDDALAANLAGITPLLRRFLDFETELNPARLFDNRAWTVSLSLIDFLRDVGKHATVNQMVAKDSVRVRMDGEDGISFTEFTYMLLQANDFLWLHENEHCDMQIGGSDQWGNISLGVDLVRRRTGTKVHALTWPLLLKKDGTKYGKTAGGETVWLTADKMSPYRFYQSWMQTDDSDIRKLLLQLTFLSVSDIEDEVASHEQAPHLRSGQKLLANELTTLIHGSQAAAAAETASSVVFGSSTDGIDEPVLKMLSQEIPTTPLSRSSLGTEGNLVQSLVEGGVASSKSEAARLLKQNGISINDRKVDSAFVINLEDLRFDRYCLVRRGKKAVYLLKYV